MTEDKYICPKCGSSNICKLSIIYRNGISSSEGNASQHQDFLGVNDVRISAKSQSEASKGATPPINPFEVFIGWIGLEIINYIIFYTVAMTLEHYFKQSQSSLAFAICTGIYLLVALLITLGCLIMIITYPSDKAKWNDSYHCQRCDSVFLLKL